MVDIFLPFDMLVHVYIQKNMSEFSPGIVIRKEDFRESLGFIEQLVFESISGENLETQTISL